MMLSFDISVHCETISTINLINTFIISYIFSFFLSFFFFSLGENTSSVLLANFSCVIQLVQSLSRVLLFATPWTAALQACLSITNSQSLFQLMSIESVMPSNHLILCHLPLLLPSIFPSIRVFSNKSALHIR